MSTQETIATLYGGKIVIKTDYNSWGDSWGYYAYVVFKGQEYFIGNTCVLHRFDDCFEKWVNSLIKKRMDKLPASVKSYKEEYERLHAQHEVFKSVLDKQDAFSKE